MNPQRRTIAIVTGSRAEFGLLEPVIAAVQQHEQLAPDLIVTGSHLLGPNPTAREVRDRFPIGAEVTMQQAAPGPGGVGRWADAAALGRGIQGLVARFERTQPDVVLVLGDRIEAFAAAGAAAIGGVRVAHLHGGDRAQGIADESIRHAITKLAHVHLPATEPSAHRLVAMGEEPRRVHVVGSPAVDGLDSIPALDDATFNELERPEIVLLLHPCGRDDDVERREAEAAIRACRSAGRLLVMQPNHDPGRRGVAQAIEASGARACHHLRRHQFIGLLRRAGLLVGNSSAGLIECAALGVPAINLGLRQSGRERGGNVIDLPAWDEPALAAAIERARRGPPPPAMHPFGDGRTGPRVAALLATLEPDDYPLVKRNTY